MPESFLHGTKPDEPPSRTILANIVNDIMADAFGVAYRHAMVAVMPHNVWQAIPETA